MRRRRLARLLERISLFVFGPYAETWEAWSQERIDAEIAAARETDEPVNIVRPG